uniref:Transmembrane protein n=1 Tax=Anopheles melas TaxID=34690 RepID=A0A182U666_9DIPT
MEVAWIMVIFMMMVIFIVVMVVFVFMFEQCFMLQQWQWFSNVVLMLIKGYSCTRGWVIIADTLLHWFWYVNVVGFFRLLIDNGFRVDNDSLELNYQDDSHLKYCKKKYIIFV